MSTPWDYERRGYGGQRLGDRITPREREVMACVAQGLSQKEIARVLGISVGTIKCHRFSIGIKLGIRTRQQLTVYCVISKALEGLV